MSRNDLMGLALQCHRSGRFADAESIYDQILLDEPNHADALHLKGVIAHQTGRSNVAIALIQRAISLNPSIALYYTNLAHILREKGRHDDAIAACRQAIRLMPDYAEPYINLGNALQDCGQANEAIAAYREAIRLKPEHAPTFSNLGGALASIGQLEEAIAAFRQSLHLDPNYAEPYSDLAHALRQKGQIEEAVAFARRAIQLKSDYPEAHNNLGCALSAQQKFAEAIDAFREAIRLKPDFWTAHTNLGNNLYLDGQFAESATAYQQALRFKPDDANNHNNLGGALLEIGDLEESIAAFRRAIAINPDFAEAHNNLGKALVQKSDVDKSIVSCRKAIQIRPDFVDAHFALAFGLLIKGCLTEGWTEYEWRLKRERAESGRREFPKPRWDGTDLHDRTILLHAEQGFGDTIQFARYARLVAARGGRIIVECQPALKRLLCGLPAVEQVVARGNPLPEFDLHCQLMSLPAIFKTDMDSIPAPVPYVTPDPRLPEASRDRLPRSSFRIGLAWAGSPGQKRDRDRSIGLEYFAPFAHLSDTTFFSLQKGEAGKQRAPSGMDFRDYTADFSDFADTAALVENLDLVITVDTAIAHLAGMMGKPVWVLLAFSADWRWLLDRDDSPWYPTMRLFRQRTPGNWTDVIERISQVFEERSKGR